MLVWKLSRFGRDIEEGLIYRAVLRKMDIELISYKEPIPEDPLGTLITHVLMAVDQFYAAAIAADVLRPQKELARQRFSAGGRPPVGYRREPVQVGTRYDGTPLTRVRRAPDPDAAPRVVQAFQMAAEGIGYDEIVAATRICHNKSSLATIFANPIHRGVKVFNRETRVEGEHGRKRRRSAPADVVTSEVGPIAFLTSSGTGSRICSSDDANTALLPSDTPAALSSPRPCAVRMKAGWRAPTHARTGTTAASRGAVVHISAPTCSTTG